MKKITLVEGLGIAATGLGIFATLYGLVRAEQDRIAKEKLQNDIRRIRDKVKA